MRLFYSAVPIALLLLLAQSQEDHQCYPPDSDFARLNCECRGGNILCEDDIDEFPVLNGTYPSVKEL